MFVAAILDAFSRRVIGWALNCYLDNELTLTALRLTNSRFRWSFVRVPECSGSSVQVLVSPMYEKCIPIGRCPRCVQREPLLTGTIKIGQNVPINRCEASSWVAEPKFKWRIFGFVRPQDLGREALSPRLARFLTPRLSVCPSSSSIARKVRPSDSTPGGNESFASPKSRIFACPLFVTKMFAGLMSRWMIPLE